MFRLNFGGDSSEKGMKQSFGMMINYLYDLDLLEERQRAYIKTGTVSCTKDDVSALKAQTIMPASKL